jgi:hypothetical protein
MQPKKRALKSVEGFNVIQRIRSTLLNAFQRQPSTSPEPSREVTARSSNASAAADRMKPDLMMDAILLARQAAGVTPE